MGIWKIPCPGRGPLPATSSPTTHRDKHRSGHAQSSHCKREVEAQLVQCMHGKSQCQAVGPEGQHRHARIHTHKEGLKQCGTGDCNRSRTLRSPEFLRKKKSCFWVPFNRSKLLYLNITTDCAIRAFAITIAIVIATSIAQSSAQSLTHNPFCSLFLLSSNLSNPLRVQEQITLVRICAMIAATSALRALAKECECDKTKGYESKVVPFSNVIDSLGPCIRP